MTRLIDFSIGTPVDPPEESRPINLRFVAFGEAVRWHMHSRRIDAPFGKLVIDIRVNRPGPPTLAVPRASMVIGLARVFATVDYDVVLSGEPSQVRALASELSMMALDAIAAEVHWRDSALELFVESAGRHQGRYRYHPERLKIGLRSGLTCGPVLEIDEAGSTVLLECRDGESLVSSTEIASRPEPTPFWMFFNAAKVRRVGGVVEFLDRWGDRLGGAELPPTKRDS